MTDRLPYGADTIVIPFTFVRDQTAGGKPAVSTPPSGGSMAPTSTRVRSRTATSKPTAPSEAPQDPLDGRT